MNARGDADRDRRNKETEETEQADGDEEEGDEKEEETEQVDISAEAMSDSSRSVPRMRLLFRQKRGDCRVDGDYDIDCKSNSISNSNCSSSRW